MKKEEIIELISDLEAKLDKKQEASANKVKEMTKLLNDHESRFDEPEGKFNKESDSHVLDDSAAIMFHMQCVVHIATSFSPSSTRWMRHRGWIMSVASFALVIFQFILLHFLTLEASSPTCARNTDCNIGAFCDPYGGTTQPRCTDCNMREINYYQIDDYDYNRVDDYDSCKEAYGDYEEDVLVWMSSDGKYHPDLDNRGIYCINTLHCVESNIGFDGNRMDGHYSVRHCDYLELNMATVSWIHVMIFLLAAILLASALQPDITESIIEEKLLDYALKKENVEGRPLTVEVIRVAFRLRKFVIPWMVAGTTATIIIRSPITVKNLLLNLLAIGFITEVDSLVGKLFLSQTHKDLVNKFVRGAKQSKDVCFKVSFWWSRILAILPVTVMVVAVVNIKQFLSFVSEDMECQDIELLFGFVFFCCFPFIIVTVEIIIVFGRNKNNVSNILQRIISCMHRVSQNYNALFAIAFLWTTLSMSIHISSEAEDRADVMIIAAVFVTNAIFVYLFHRQFGKRRVLVALSAFYFCFLMIVILFSCFLLFNPGFLWIFGVESGDSDDYYDDYDDK